MNPDVEDRDQLLEQFADLAAEQGWVHESFSEALVAREIAHPTGIPTAVPAAIPHTDPEHVIHAGVGAAILSDPVEFREMGNPDGVVAARLVLLLLVTDAGRQVKLLSRLITGLQDPDLADRLADVDTPRALATVVTGLLADDVTGHAAEQP